jgi:hypothetical protein
MGNIIAATILLMVLAGGLSAQKAESPKETPAVTVADGKKAAIELAKKAMTAHGGDKFRNMKTLVVRGSADISGSPTQTFPAAFATIYSGDKYRFELTNPFQPFKQVYDGEQTISSVPNFTLPPINRLGLPLLQRIDEKGFEVSELPDKSKKKTGFRITSPEGFYTDFFLDEKTFEVKSYEASYSFNERSVTTSVAIDRFKEVEGVKIPERYAQRFELGFATFYTDFKAKEILVNSEVSDDVFTMK